MNQRTIILIPTIILLFVCETLGQSHVKLFGQVITPSGDPASFAHVFIKEKNMGGITDIDGYFKYYISEQYYHDQLLISLVGYKTLEVSVKDLVDNPGQVLHLDENIIQLENVTIRAPQQVMKEALTAALEDHNPSQYYSKSGVITITRQEDEDYTLFEEIGFNSYYRGLKEQRPLIGYEPTGQRRSFDHSTFPYILARGSGRSFGISYFFGASAEHSLADAIGMLDSLDLEITDIVEEEGRKLYVITRVRKKGALTNYYVDVDQSLLKKVEFIANQNQVSTYIGGSPFNSSKYNRFRYLFADTYHFDIIDGKFTVTKVTHEGRIQYIERLTGYIHSAYKDQINVQFFNYTPLSEKPKKYRDEFRIPLSMSYEPTFWKDFEQKHEHKISKEISTSLGTSKSLSDQFAETDGKVVRAQTSIKSSFNKKDQKKQAKVDDLDQFIQQLTSNNYSADYPPELDWDDIPKLLEIANSNVTIDRFPRNILSRLYLQECQVGIIAMWLIDSIRKNHGKRARKAWYISPMALLQNGEDRQATKKRGGGNEYVPVNSEEKLQQAYEAFTAWWTNAQTISVSKSKRVNPLDGSGLNWMWR